MAQRHGIIWNWYNQDQLAKSFQMRYNLSKLNNQNYQTVTSITSHPKLQKISIEQKNAAFIQGF